MKKYIIIIFLAFVFSLFGAITVLNPNGGETIPTGNPYEITWDDNTPKDIRIELFQNDVYHSDIVLATVSDGSYIWDIPKGVPGENYQVKITSVINPSQFDFSDGYFTMTLDDSINVVAPSGGENLVRGSQFSILWDDNISENVLIELYQNDVYHSDITLSTPSSGSFSWDISENVYGSNYQIKISSVEIPLATNDLSEGYFDIAQGSLTILSPNGGEELTRGNQYEISWTDDIPENVKIELYQNDVYYSDIILSTPSVGSYLWDVPNDLYGSNYQIKVISTTFPIAINDVSDGYFDITAGEIVITYPNGGEAFDRGDPINISWTDNIFENVKIELYENDVFHSDIITSTESDGSYVWNIPTDISGMFKIKVTSLDYEVINDMSDNTFEVLIGAVVLLTPDGGETITRGGQYEITWIDNITENVKLELYENDIYHSDIILSTSSNGSYLWNIPNDLSGSNFQVKISSISLPAAINDISDGYFTILEGIVIVLTPNGGETLERDGQYEITWIDEILEDVKIELYQNDAYHSDLVTSIASDSSYIWNIPNDLSGLNFQIKVSSLAIPTSAYDFSDGYFTISEGMITILTPNGGDRLDRNSQCEIIWTDNIPDHVKIELYENDIFHSTIIDTTESDGSYEWTIPLDLAGIFKVKISSLDYPGVQDLSDATFEVLTGRITVTSPIDEESLSADSQYELTWGDNISENVTIELYQNDAYHSEIIASTPSDGSYFWNIEDGVFGLNFQIKISSTVIPMLTNDFSTGYFTITDNTIIVSTPNGGEDFICGTPYEITWEDKISENVKIELYQNDVYHSDISASALSDGSYHWFVPYGLQGFNYKVKISSVTMPELYTDISDGSFSITLGSISLLAPQAGNTLEMLEYYTIEWNDNIYEGVIISLYKNTSLIATINSPSSGSCVWDFYTNEIVAGTDYNLRIESKYSDLVYDETGPFTIKGTNNVTGSVFGVWTEPNSPYILTGNTYVSSINSLLIEPRVKVKGAPSHINFDIQGKMESLGEFNSEINFKNIDLSYNNSSNPDTSKVEYTVFDRDYNDELFEYDKIFGGASTDYGYSVKQTTDGGYIVVGITSSYGAGGDDVWLIKTGPDGNMEWDKTFGGTDFDSGTSVEQTADGGYIITGSTYSYGAGESDVWLIKTDPNGIEEWNKFFGGSSRDVGYEVQQTSDGGYVITGYTTSYGAGESDVWLIKTDPDGNMEWNKTFGGVTDDFGFSVEQTYDNGYIITGDTYSYGAGGKDIWLIKTNSIGDEEWNNTYGGFNEDAGSSVKQTTDGGYVITGSTYSYGAGKYDVWLIKTDPNGNMVWDKTIGGSSDDVGKEIQQTYDDGYIITGYTSSFALGGKDVWLIKTDADGNIIWEKTFGGVTDDLGFCVEQTVDGGFVVIATTNISGGWDAWLVKTDAYGSSTYAYAVISINNNSKLIMQNSTIRNYNDYGLIVNNATPVITNNQITGNSGGIKFKDSSPQFISNNTLVDNESVCLYFDGNSDPQLKNNILYGNGAYEVYINDNNSNPTFLFNDIKGGISDFGLHAGVVFTGTYTSNIDVDPLFVGSTYQLQEASPCKDSGSPGIIESQLEALYLPQTDIIGNPRLSGEIDMGAYEYYVVDAPETPTNVVTSVSSSTLKIDWDIMLNANSYLVYSSNDPYGTFEYLAMVSENTYSVVIDADTKKFYFIVSCTVPVKENEIRGIKKNIRVKYQAR